MLVCQLCFKSFYRLIDKCLYKWHIKHFNLKLVLKWLQKYLDWSELFELLSSASVKEPTCQCGRYKRCKFDPWVGKILWRRAWLPTPVFLPGESQGQWSLTGYIQSMGSQRVGHDWVTNTLYGTPKVNLLKIQNCFYLINAPVDDRVSQSFDIIFFWMLELLPWNLFLQEYLLMHFLLNPC